MNLLEHRNSMPNCLKYAMRITVNDFREFEGGWEGLSCTKLGKANSEEERAVKLQMQQGGGLWVLDLISNHTTLTTGELGGC